VSDDLLTVREASERLGRAPGFVRALVADGLDQEIGGPDA
jgi:hypothetical protein